MAKRWKQPIILNPMLRDTPASLLGRGALNSWKELGVVARPTTLAPDWRPTVPTYVFRFLTRIGAG